MSALTITEALAEIKLIGKRLEKKRVFILANLGRAEGAKDPLEKDGGQIAVIQSEENAIGDLETRVISLRRAIQRANDETQVTVGAITRSISDWLIWKREVLPKHKEHLTAQQQHIAGYRQHAKGRNAKVVAANTADADPNDIVVNISERELARKIEDLEVIIGTLDGQLSLKNATVIINIDEAS